MIAPDLATLATPIHVPRTARRPSEGPLPPLGRPDPDDALALGRPALGRDELDPPEAREGRAEAARPLPREEPELRVATLAG